MKFRFPFPRFSKFQILIHLAALTPLVWLIFDYLTDNLTFNPIQAATLRTGRYAIILLVLSLACTPINTILGFRQVIKVRRALGLYAFMYAGIHFMIFLGVDYRFDLGLIFEEIVGKRYIIAGFTAGLILIPLAITSTRGWMKRLGVRWKQLHKLTYLAGLLAVTHYIWVVKSDYRVPLAVGVIVVLLLVARLPKIRKHLANLRATRRVKAFISKRGRLSHDHNQRKRNHLKSNVYTTNELES